MICLLKQGILFFAPDIRVVLLASMAGEQCVVSSHKDYSGLELQPCRAEEKEGGRVKEPAKLFLLLHFPVLRSSSAQCRLADGGTHYPVPGNRPRQKGLTRPEQRAQEGEDCVHCRERFIVPCL